MTFWSKFFLPFEISFILWFQFLEYVSPYRQQKTEHCYVTCWILFATFISNHQNFTNARIQRDYFSSKRKGDINCICNWYLFLSGLRANFAFCLLDKLGKDSKKISWIYCMVYEKYNSPWKLSNHRIHFPLTQANDLKP